VCVCVRVPTRHQCDTANDSVCAYIHMLVYVNTCHCVCLGVPVCVCVRVSTGLHGETANEIVCAHIHMLMYMNT